MKPSLPPLRNVIATHNLRAKRSLGQNFLLDLNLTDKIARAAGDLNGVNVIEIGPGPGGLTRALLNANAGRVIAIEHDWRCFDAIGELQSAYPDRLTVIKANALKINITKLAPVPRKIVANLPYNIATPLLIGWLRLIADDPGSISSMTLMFQREVADRLVAEPRSKDYGRLTIISQWLCQVRRQFNLPPEAFTPPPKVGSALVGFTPRAEPIASADWSSLEKVTAAAFSQRRKMLRSSLRKLDINLQAVSIEAKYRAEELTVDQFLVLARALSLSEKKDDHET